MLLGTSMCTVGLYTHSGGCSGIQTLVTTVDGVGGPNLDVVGRMWQLQLISMSSGRPKAGHTVAARAAYCCDMADWPQWAVEASSACE